MRRLTRLAIIGIAAGGLAVGMTGPALANTSDANLRPDDIVGLQIVDDDDDNPDPRGGNCRWVPDNTRDVTRDATLDATTDGIDTRPGFTLTCTNGEPTDNTRGDVTRGDDTRDMTRSVDFTRDLTNTNTNTRGR